MFKYQIQLLKSIHFHKHVESSHDRHTILRQGVIISEVMCRTLGTSLYYT